MSVLSRKLSPLEKSEIKFSYQTYVRKINVTRQFYEANDPRGRFLEKKIIFRYSLGECVYQISGIYHFSFGQ